MSFDSIDLNAVVLVFVAFVMPMWIVFHYATRWRASRGLAAQDEKVLADLWEAARRMEERLDNLERVLGPEPQRRTP
jgi:phage shock protein B